MKRFLLIPILLLAFLANGLHAQDGKGKDSTQTASGAERVQALKVAFITDRLSLTAAEAEKFWPIYNEYQDKRDAVRKQMQDDYEKIRTSGDQLSPEELLRISDEIMTLRQQDIDLQKEMHEKLKKVLPAKKLAQLYVAEEDFKRELVRILTQGNAKENPKGNKK